MGVQKGREWPSRCPPHLQGTTDRPVSGLSNRQRPRRARTRASPSRTRQGQWRLMRLRSITVAGAVPGSLSRAHRLPV